MDMLILSPLRHYESHRDKIYLHLHKSIPDFHMQLQKEMHQMMLCNHMALGAIREQLH